MAFEKKYLYRNIGTEESPIWEKWFIKTIAEAVFMSEENEDVNIKQYVDQKIADLIGSAPEFADTLEELAALIAANEDVATALNQAITEKASKTELAAVQSTAEAAQTAATNAGIAAGAAQTTADSAVTAAATADGKAVTAQTTADNAVTAAGTAQTAAENAATAAATADAKAVAAQTAADNASNAASAAQTTANKKAEVYFDVLPSTAAPNSVCYK